MFSKIPDPNLKNEIKAALKDLDLASLKRKIEENRFDINFVCETIVGLAGNMLHYFCYETNPGRASLFYSEPPFYMDETVKFNHSIKDCKNLISLLLSYGISLEANDNYFKQTPLSTAIGFDNNPAAIALIEILQEQKKFELLNAMNTNVFNSTPLLLSIQKGNKEIFEKLLATGMVDVNQPDHFGLTPLHWAVIMCSPEMIVRLIAQGANQSALSNNGKTPRDYLDIKKEDIDPVGRRILIEGKLETIYDNDSTQLPELRPIMAHFNNKRDIFINSRNEKFKLYEEIISSALPVQISEINDADVNSEKESEEATINNDIDDDKILSKTINLSFFAQKEAEEKLRLREKNKELYSYHPHDELNLDHLLNRTSGILQTSLDLSKSETDFVRENPELAGKAIYIPKYIERMVNEYNYPTEMAEILVRKTIEFDVEFSDEEKEKMEAIHKHQLSHVQTI